MHVCPRTHARARPGWRWDRVVTEEGMYTTGMYVCMYVHTMDRWDGMGGPQRPPAGRRGEERRGEMAGSRETEAPCRYIHSLHTYVHTEEVMMR